MEKEKVPTRRRKAGAKVVRARAAQENPTIQVQSSMALATNVASTATKRRIVGQARASKDQERASGARTARAKAKAKTSTKVKEKTGTGKVPSQREE